jgi:uncharacterized protein with PhoU and TrkA domain
LKSLERKKKTVETAHLLKDLMNHKQLLRREESETEKMLGVMAVKANDTRIERSMNDYQNLVQSKQKLNQLILKASKDHTIRNFSTVEQERNGSLERLFEKH